MTFPSFIPEAIFMICEEIGMYMLAEFASDQAHGGLGFSDAKNNNIIDQFDIEIGRAHV